jgi:hypothetical protein
MEIKSHTMNASESVVYIVIRDRDKLDYGWDCIGKPRLMTQTMYAHVNKRIKKKKRKPRLRRCRALCCRLFELLLKIVRKINKNSL